MRLHMERSIALRLQQNVYAVLQLYGDVYTRPLLNSKTFKSCDCHNTGRAQGQTSRSRPLCYAHPVDTGRMPPKFPAVHIAKNHRHSTDHSRSQEVLLQPRAQARRRCVHTHQSPARHRNGGGETPPFATNIKAAGGTHPVNGTMQKAKNRSCSI